MRSLLIASFLVSACSTPQRPSPNAAPRLATITLLGTNDLHGHVEALPYLASYVRAVRDARSRDQGGTVLVDAGDLFQGTIASNAFEGAPVIAAYNAIGYDAVAIGNHDFDYGARDDAPPGAPNDTRGALLARASEARFPFLTANVLDRESHRLVNWPHVAPSTTIDVAGVRVGIVGVTTSATLDTTLASNVRDLAMARPRDAIVAEASRLRANGAVIVIAVAHAGGRCRDLEHADDATSCEQNQEIVEIAGSLPAGTVDAIVAGHTHQAMANVVNGIPVIESYALGRAFGRVDFRVDVGAHRVVDRRVFPPRDLCRQRPTREHPCEPGEYEGVAIAPDANVASIIAPSLERATQIGARPLGVSAAATIRTQYDREAPLGNLLADLLREAAHVDVAILNGGGIRADLPAGPLTYGHVYEVMPFDNREAIVEMRGAGLRALVEENLRHEAGIISVSGVRAVAECRGGSLVITLTRENGAPLADDTTIRVVTSDFLVAGGDGLFGGGRIVRDVTPDEPPMLRDVFAERLSARAPVVRGDDPAHPRLAYPGTRPLRCEH